ncbi:MAG: hypothetical protein AAF517_02830 [Planctomycetota bacterium]
MQTIRRISGVVLLASVTGCSALESAADALDRGGAAANRLLQSAAKPVVNASNTVHVTADSLRNAIQSSKRVGRN